MDEVHVSKVHGHGQGTSPGQQQYQPSKEVKKMTDFIFQEATEKAKEIRLRADEEHAVERARLLKAESAVIEALVKKKRREEETLLKVTQSKQANACRLSVLRERESRLDEVFEQARQQLASVGQYDKLICDLLVEGLCKVCERDNEEVSVACAPGDKQLLAASLATAQSSFKAISGLDVRIKLGDKSLAEGSKGVVLMAKGGKVECDNTLETRLNLAFEKLLPEIREEVFGPSPNRKFRD